MLPNSRMVLLAGAFAVTVAAGITGLTYRGETKEAGFVENACAAAAWPLIPARCLDGGRGHDVRVVADTQLGYEVPPGPVMNARFKTDFE
jgi:hypothetical protein